MEVQQVTVTAGSLAEGHGILLGEVHAQDVPCQEGDPGAPGQGNHVVAAGVHSNVCVVHQAVLCGVDGVGAPDDKGEVGRAAQVDVPHRDEAVIGQGVVRVDDVSRVPPVIRMLSGRHVIPVVISSPL